MLTWLIDHIMFTACKFLSKYKTAWHLLEKQFLIFYLTIQFVIWIHSIWEYSLYVFLCDLQINETNPVRLKALWINKEQAFDLISNVSIGNGCRLGKLLIISCSAPCISCIIIYLSDFFLHIETTYSLLYFIVCCSWGLKLMHYN